MPRERAYKWKMESGKWKMENCGCVTARDALERSGVLEYPSA